MIERVLEKLSVWRIFLFWAPLSATWLMMSLEGPYLSALIARLAEPKFNLAAYGVAFSLALLFEAPIIMILSAATALAEDRDSLIKMRRFTYALNAAVTGLMLLAIIPAVFDFLAYDLMGLPAEVGRLTHIACLLLLPWPGAIGYRRLYQGVLIRQGKTSYVAYGTIIRLAGMSLSALACHLLFPDLPGAWVGAVGLSCGVTAEAGASRLMARRAVAQVMAMEATAAEPLTYRGIASFYYPLALTTLMTLGTRPVVTFFLGQSLMALESLAALPVVHALAFIFMSFGFSFHEVGIALLGDGATNREPLTRFAVGLGLITSLALALIAFTPLADLWLAGISGLSRELTEFSRLPLQIMVLLPGLSVLVFFQRSVMVRARQTKPITWATFLEVGVIISSLWLAIAPLSLVGLVGAATAFTLGRLAVGVYQWPHYRRSMASLCYRGAGINGDVEAVCGPAPAVARGVLFRRKKRNGSS